MQFVVDKLPTQREFIQNMEEKMAVREFTNDIHVILRPNVVYDNTVAYELIKKQLLEKL